MHITRAAVGAVCAQGALSHGTIQISQGAWTTVLANMILYERARIGTPHRRR